MKRVLIVSTSMRENSNSAQLAKQFQRGAQEAGHEVQYIAEREAYSVLFGLFVLSKNRMVCHS